MGEATGKLKETWRTLGPRGQLGVAASGLLVLVTLFFLFQMVGKASYTTLTSGLEAADSAQVAKALDSAGIQYQLRNGGTEIAVVLVNPDDLAVVRESAAELSAALGGIRRLEIVPERRVVRGGCLVQTAEGEIDATLQVQLDRAREVLTAGLRQAADA